MMPQETQETDLFSRSVAKYRNDGSLATPFLFFKALFKVPNWQLKDSLITFQMNFFLSVSFFVGRRRQGTENFFFDFSHMRNTDKCK